MNACRQFEPGVVELYFYDELDARERASVALHIASCAVCRQEFEELEAIRAALSTRPVVSAPPGGDWTAFMTRLDKAVARDKRPPVVPIQSFVDGRRESARPALTRRAAPYLTMAALLALVTMSVAYVARTGWGRDRPLPSSPSVARGGEAPTAPAAEPVTIEAAFTALSEQHFERSKLVVLGIASKDPRQARSEDWEYERQLASSLLSDTRLYRMTAEERGFKQIADVMGDLELVLLQASHGAPSDTEDLEQIQRLIDKRDLVTKMGLVAGI